MAKISGFYIRVARTISRYCEMFIITLFINKPKNLELEGICKTLKKAGIVMSLLISVTYGKYATYVPDVVAYKYYECFRSQ